SRQRSHIPPTDRPIHAQAEVVGAPVSPMLPTPIVPLQHDFTRQVGRVEIDISIELVSAVDLQGRRRPGEVMLMLPRGDVGLTAGAPRIRTRTGCYPGPAIATISIAGGAVGQAILDPDRPVLDPGVGLVNRPIAIPVVAETLGKRRGLLEDATQ